MKSHSLSLATALFASLLLAACNGGGGDAEVPLVQTEVPASAAASPQALVEWAGAQATSETTEPLTMVNFMPPVSDTDEPAAIR